MEETWIIVFAGLWIGLTKGGLGGPIAGAVLLPLLSQIMTVTEAIGITLPLLMIGDVFAMRFYWRKWDMQYIRLVLPAALIGVLAGTALLAVLPDIVLRRLLGVITLLIIAYKVFGDRLTGQEYEARDWHGYVAGGGSGFMSALANSGGPPITAYLLLNKVAPVTFIGTITLFFTIVNWTKIPGFIAADILEIERLLSIAWMLPIIPLGVWAGRSVVGRINRVLFERLMIVFLFISALILLFQAPPVTDEDDEATAAAFHARIVLVQMSEDMP